MPFKEGEQVGPYRVMEQLGRGGMATVFKAYHANLDRYVALKVLHPAFMEDPNFEKRFQREARVVAKLEHPNIIPVYDFAEDEGRSYLVMKYVEGKTLKGHLNERPLTPEEGVKIIEAVGEGLAYAHKQGILHRDIKPSNVMLESEGQIYLTDFGLARIASAGESTLSGDMMIGTPQYISPEQAMGKRDLDDGTDIYSFGVLMYEIVVGQVPFASDTPFSIIHDHIYTPLPMPRSVNPNVPENIERILLKSLAKEREDRFETVGEMVEAFKRAVEGEPLPEVWPEPTSQIIRSANAETATPTPVPTEFTTPPPTPQTQPPGTISSATPIHTEPVPEKKGRWRRWMAIPLVLGLCFCLMVVFNAMRNAQGGGGIQFHETPGIFVEFDDGETAESPAEEAEEPEEDVEAEPADALEQALERVEQSPDDPNAYLELAAAYYDQGDTAQAIEAYEAGLELAGEDPLFHVTFGDMLAARELWLQALTQYMQAFDYGYGEDDVNFYAKVSKAAYFAVEDETAEDVFFQDDTDQSELALAVRARYLALSGDPEQAMSLISTVLTAHPESQVGRLVQAEIHILVENEEDAEELLSGLLDDETTLPWIKVEARKLLSEIE